MKWLQRWTDVLFLHYPVDTGEVAPFLPPRLEVDTFGGQAWISYVLFRMTVRPAGLPFVPGFSSLTELNVRTYVRHRGQSGIYFLRMYADNTLAIRAARWLTPLRYQFARMRYERPRAGWRNASVLPSGGNDAADQAYLPFSIRFRCCGQPAASQPGSLDAWLLERYRLYVDGQDGAVIAADVQHPPWEFSTIEVQKRHSGGGQGRLPSREAQLRHYSPGVAARFDEFQVVGGKRGERTKKDYFTGSLGGVVNKEALAADLSDQQVVARQWLEESGVAGGRRNSSPNGSDTWGGGD